MEPPLGASRYQLLAHPQQRGGVQPPHVLGQEGDPAEVRRPEPPGAGLGGGNGSADGGLGGGGVGVGVGSGVGWRGGGVGFQIFFLEGRTDLRRCRWEAVSFV